MYQLEVFYLATDWMTLEEVSLMLVRKRPVPSRKISMKPLPDWSGSYMPVGETAKYKLDGAQIQLRKEIRKICNVLFQNVTIRSFIAQV